MFLFLSLCTYHHRHKQVIYLFINECLHRIQLSNKRYYMHYIQKNSLISLGSCFRQKKYENCSNMKLKWRGECNYEVKFWIHESK